VPLGGYSLPPQARAAQVISIDTDSRSLSTDQAYAKIKQASQQLIDGGWTDFYKSVDSTLRGNLGAEIEAVMDVVKPDFAIIAPAFPKYGRTTVDGVQYLHGRPLHETEFGTDPTAPVKDANIARRLAEGSRRRVGRLTIEELRAGPMHRKGDIRGLLADKAELVVVDIAEQEDLKRLCLGFSRTGLKIVWVGSTGLAEFVPLAFGASSTANAFGHDHKIDLRPALALIGSASETTRQQLRFAEANDELKMIYLDPARMIENDESEIKKTDVNLRSALDSGDDVALVLRSSREEIAATQRLGATLNLSVTQVAQQIVDKLAQVATGLIREGRISGIVATGGDTANALCNTLGAQALEILGEVEAGIPVMRIVGNQSLPLVTKAGGFGSPAAIRDALMKVKQYG
jgi:uncharacterized protein YgbK (DUF1537 family)